jgi:hypothetical protein
LDLEARHQVRHQVLLVELLVEAWGLPAATLIVEAAEEVVWAGPLVQTALLLASLGVVVWGLACLEGLEVGLAATLHATVAAWMARLLVSLVVVVLWGTEERRRHLRRRGRRRRVLLLLLLRVMN